MAQIPKSRPQWTEHRVRQILKEQGVTDKVAVLGVRGYYENTIGKPGQNDRGDYDDAIFIVSPDVFLPFNANTDPSKYRQGIAVLRAGHWRYQKGTHGLSKPAHERYQAYTQAGKVTVERDGGKVETGFFGINIHRGGQWGTSSLGCQTIPPGQWNEFRDVLNGELEEYGQKVFSYVLIEEQG